MFWVSLYPKKGLTITKQDFRLSAKARLKQRSIYGYFADKSLNRFLLSYLQAKSVRNILVYMPFGNEVDIFPLICELRKKKYRVFVPFIQELSFKMIPLRMPFHKNKYGIYESNNSIFKLIKADAVIIPVLGIDKHFRRIGFGRGMYDRFMSHLKGKVHTIFVARSPNYAPSVITEHYDVQGDCFFTPSALCIRKHNGSMVCNRKHNLWVISRRECISHQQKDISF
ncbi:5-formyltetrahydrofolate cyclo-ligase [Helicobacter sp. MIT 21-1697]|uniref:5-formyltetrahydrofolate cyclo-ligase n=1 Tax=Helicobacter sp. MIT 21-1697 TaxID=2993733 RepID=UPI00224A5848|nr:5-formyltetrahydrofolate cyclo-ligase [Helicobacter sp. MIT 21-1697]MCX2716275.1 5-formyltetrahydrofolate cyclo-ligase [Helicobacter sp. MIT 21-1697]